jgi:hypothetical protein
VLPSTARTLWAVVAQEGRVPAIADRLPASTTDPRPNVRMVLNVNDIMSTVASQPFRRMGSPV